MLRRLGRTAQSCDVEVDALADARGYGRVLGLMEYAIDIGEIARDRECRAAAGGNPERRGGGVLQQVRWSAAAGGSGDGDMPRREGCDRDVPAVESDERVGAIPEGFRELGKERTGAKFVEVETGEHSSVRGKVCREFVNRLFGRMAACAQESQQRQELLHGL